MTYEELHKILTEAPDGELVVLSPSMGLQKTNPWDTIMAESDVLLFGEDHTLYAYRRNGLIATVDDPDLWNMTFWAKKEEADTPLIVEPKET